MAYIPKYHAGTICPKCSQWLIPSVEPSRGLFCPTCGIYPGSGLPAGAKGFLSEPPQPTGAMYTVNCQICVKEIAKRQGVVIKPDKPGSTVFMRYHLDCYMRKAASDTDMMLWDILPFETANEDEAKRCLILWLQKYEKLAAAVVEIHAVAERVLSEPHDDTHALLALVKIQELAEKVSEQKA